MVVIKSNLKPLLDARGVSIRQAARENNLLFGSVRKMYNDEMERYPRDLIEKLCNYLDVTPNELLVASDREAPE